MSKIIVGVDDSIRSKDAVALATRIARVADAELVLVCAYPYDEHPSRALNSEFERALREQAEGRLAQARAEAGDLARVSTRPIADVSAAKAIQTVAEREHASLVVLGSSGHGTVGRVLAGTTAERLLHGAPCPVAVAPNGFHAHDDLRIATIGVGYDGSAEADAAVDAAMTIAAALGARVRVIEVLELLWSGMPAMTSGPGYFIPPAEVKERAESISASSPPAWRARSWSSPSCWSERRRRSWPSRPRTPT